MQDSVVTAFDAFALGLLFISGILALSRGFVREALSIAAFIAAALATLLTYPVFSPALRSIITPGWAADAAVIIGTFILVYMAVTLVTHHFTTQLRGGKDVGTLDRSAGFAFGLVRGMALLGLALIMFSQLTPADRMPGWLIHAKMYPAINATARALQSLAPSSSRVNDSPVNASLALDPPPKSEKSAAHEEDKGYGRNERQSLDQLITTTAEDDKKAAKDKKGGQ